MGRTCKRRTLREAFVTRASFLVQRTLKGVVTIAVPFHSGQCMSGYNTPRIGSSRRNSGWRQPPQQKEASAAAAVGGVNRRSSRWREPPQQ